MHYSQNSPAKKRRLSKLLRPIPLAICGVALLVVIVAVLELTNVTHFFHKKSVPATIPTTSASSSPSPSASQPGQTSNPTVSGSQSATTDTKATAPTAGNGDLIPPYGTFVSNHKPGQAGSPTSESSICSSTPGATCYIQFTNGSQVTKLAAQTIGSDGSTTWSWDANTLSKGSWQILAVATLNGTSKSTPDPTSLEVQ